MSLSTRVFYGLMVFFCLGIAAYAAQYWLPATMGSEGQLTNRFGPYALALHAGGGSLALLLGPIQFLGRLRARSPWLHRLTGRLYVLACTVSGLAGIALAIGTHAGPVAALGFGGLGIIWLYTTWQAVRLALKGEYDRHREWMVRSFALTLAAVSLRIILPLLMISGLGMERSYEIVAWACWVPNLVLAQLWLGLRKPRLVPAGVS